MRDASSSRVQSILGEFESLQEAQQAVRLLERHSVSIQDVVIADRKLRTWRKLHGASGQNASRRFPVLMIADPPEIERVRQILQGEALDDWARPPQPAKLS